MSSPRCSIVVRAYNEEKHIGRLLSGIMQQTVSEVEIILVDSGSTDATLAIASRFPVKVLSISPDDFTFGRSLNIGCQASKADYLVFASAHVYPVYPDWLENLLSPFSDPEVALVYGKQRGADGTRYSEHQHFSKLFPDQKNLRQRSPFCNNANAAVRKRLWLEHAYDEDLPGLEDLEWASWAVAQGHRLAYVPDAEVIHVHEETPGQIYNRYRREAIALKRIQPKESFHVWDFGRLFIGNVVSDLWHAVRDGVLLSVFSEVVWFRLMQFLGTYRGFSQSGPLTSDLKRTFFYPKLRSQPSSSTDRKVAPIEYSQTVGSSDVADGG